MSLLCGRLLAQMGWRGQLIGGLGQKGDIGKELVI